MSQEQEKNLVDQANRILAQAGCSTDGRPKTAKRESLKAISTPCGGKLGYRR